MWVNTAETVYAALKIIVECPVDLVIMDVGFPDYMRFGAVAYLLKPFNFQEVLILVEYALKAKAESV